MISQDEANDHIDRTGLFIDHELSADRLLLSYKLEKVAKLKALEAEMKSSSSARKTPLQRRKDFILWNKSLRHKYIAMFETQIKFEEERKLQLNAIQAERMSSCRKFIESLNSEKVLDCKKQATPVHVVVPIAPEIIANADKGLIRSLAIWNDELERYTVQVSRQLEDVGHEDSETDPQPIKVSSTDEGSKIQHPIVFARDKGLQEEFRSHTVQHLNSFNAEAASSMQRMASMVEESMRRRFVRCSSDLRTGLYEPVDHSLAQAMTADPKAGAKNSVTGVFSSRYAGSQGNVPANAAGSPGGRQRRSSAGAVSYPQHFTDALWELGLKEGDVREKVASSKDGYDALALQLDTRLLDLHERVLTAQTDRLKSLDAACERLESVS